MKKIILLCLFFITALSASWAQADIRFNYQAAARHTDGAVMKNEPLMVRMTIREGATAEDILYQEEHDVSTNDFGIFNLVIGGGQILSGDMQTIDWGSSRMCVQIEIKSGSNDWQDMGTTELLAVPIAAYANYAANGPEGPQGAKGEQGPQGPQGEIGPDGPEGPQGPRGDQGVPGTGVTIVGSVPGESDLPGNYSGNTGDIFIDDSNGSAWVWDGSGWNNVGQLQGPQGPEGEQGIQGAQGPQGEQGDAGPQGAQGDQGPIGPQGAPGENGATGPQGPQGDAGPQGVQGEQGPAGDAQWVENGANIHYSAGNVGIGDDAPGNVLDIKFNVTNTFSGVDIVNENTTGDAGITMGVDNTFDYNIGVDNSAGDKFKIGAGGSVGAGTFLQAGSGGIEDLKFSDNTHMTSAGLLPIGVASVNSAGGVTGGSGNVNVTRQTLDNAVWYNVTVDGQTLSSANTIIIVTANSSQFIAGKYTISGSSATVSFGNGNSSWVGTGFSISIFKF